MFGYVLRLGDDTTSLGYAGAAALTTRGIVADLRASDAAYGAAAAGAASIAADLELPGRGGPGSLARGEITVVDAVPPRAVSVTAPPPPPPPPGAPAPAAAAYKAGATRSGSKYDSTGRYGFPARPRPCCLPLAAGGTVEALYEGRHDGGRALAFNYAVREGDSADPLGYAGRAALLLNGGKHNGRVRRRRRPAAAGPWAGSARSACWAYESTALRRMF